MDKMEKFLLVAYLLTGVFICWIITTYIELEMR